MAKNNKHHRQYLASLVVTGAVLLAALISADVSAEIQLASLQSSYPQNAQMQGSDRQDLGCLAMNIYHEARGETEKGKLAVAAVTINRVKNKHYPDNVCDVVWQRKQFSWTELKHKYQLIKDKQAWINAMEIAQLFLDGGDWPGVGNATHYHSVTVSPNWKDNDLLITQVGNHLFYAL